MAKGVCHTTEQQTEPGTACELTCIPGWPLSCKLMQRPRWEEQSDGSCQENDDAHSPPSVRIKPVTDGMRIHGAQRRDLAPAAFQELFLRPGNVLPGFDCWYPSCKTGTEQESDVAGKELKANRVRK